MELTKAELESILAEVTKEYEEVVKSESVAKTMGMGGAPATPGSSKPKTSQATKEAKAASPGPGNPNAKLNLASAFKAEDSMEESSKPEASKAEDSMPEGSKGPLEKSAPAVLKAEGDEGPPKDEGDSEPSGDSEGGDSAPPSDAPAESEAPPAPAEEAPADAPPVDAQPDMVSDDASMGPDELLQLYSGLTPEHLAMHWMAASQALFQSMSGEQEAAAAQDMGAQMDPADSGDAGVPPMAKSEDVKESEEFKALQKSLDEVKAQNALLEKNLEEMADKLVKKLGMPVLNSVTSDNTISKSEETAKEVVLSKSEIVELLKNKAKDKLSDADKAKVVRYTMNPVLTPELKEFLGVK